MHRLSSFLRRKRERSSLTDSTSGDSSSNNIPQAASPSRSEVEERLASSSSQSSSQPRKPSQGQYYRAQMAEVKVLVYHNGGGQNPVVPKGLAIITHGELEEILKTSMSSLQPIYASRCCAQSTAMRSTAIPYHVHRQQHMQIPLCNSARSQSRACHTLSTSTSPISETPGSFQMHLLGLIRTMDRILHVSHSQ